MFFFEKYKNTKCPECGYNLGADWGVKQIIRENPKWYQLTHCRIHRCSDCGTSLKFKNQFFFPAFVIFLLIPSWCGYNYACDIYGEGMGFIFIVLMAIFVFLPTVLFGLSKLQVVKH